MNDLTDAEKRLLSKLRQDHRQVYDQLTRQMETYLLDFAAMHIRYFTNHGRKHFLGVIQQVSDLLSDQVLDTLSSTEILILLCCAWLHDVGLMSNVDRSGQHIIASSLRRGCCG
jgi:response regulator RpfG family c-di-GMP phosphodiesterase